MLNKQKIEIKEYFLVEDWDESIIEKEEEEGGIIKVIKIFFEIIKEEIIFFFENYKKSGGGDVEKLEYDKFIYIVVIWFIEDNGMILG